MSETRINRDEVLRLRDNPAGLARISAKRRDEMFGRRVEVVESKSGTTGDVATLVRDGGCTSLSQWPTAAQWQAGDEVLVNVSPELAEQWVDYLISLGELSHRASIVPCSTVSAGIHRLWTIAAARLLLPANIRVQARHDLIGIRLAQVALTFGADTLAGPIEPDRSLPLAGVTRPNETTPAGLAALIDQAGLEVAEAKQ